MIACLQCVFCLSNEVKFPFSLSIKVLEHILFISDVFINSNKRNVFFLYKYMYRQNNRNEKYLFMLWRCKATFKREIKLFRWKMCLLFFHWLKKTTVCSSQSGQTSYPTVCDFSRAFQPLRLLMQYTIGRYIFRFPSKLLKIRSLKVAP